MSESCLYLCIYPISLQRNHKLFTCGPHAHACVDKMYKCGYGTFKCDSHEIRLNKRGFIICDPHVWFICDSNANMRFQNRVCTFASSRVEITLFFWEGKFVGNKIFLVLEHFSNCQLFSCNCTTMIVMWSLWYFLLFMTLMNTTMNFFLAFFRNTCCCFASAHKIWDSALRLHDFTSWIKLLLNFLHISMYVN